MPDRHKLKLFSHFKPSEDQLNTSTSNSSQHGRKFLGFHIGKHDSQDSLSSPILTNTSDHNGAVTPPAPAQTTNVHSPGILATQMSRQNSQRHASGDDAHNTKSHSMVELKRLFKPVKKSSKPQGLPPAPTPGTASPAAQISAQHSREASHTSLAALINNTSSQLLHQQQSNSKRKDGPQHEPFTIDESPLVKKYGKVEKELGSGAGGSVRLIVRPSDGKTFAVKEFRPRRNTESFKDYTRKCTAEYCIGSTLKHPNIIKTIDIIHENNRYYEVMEYAPIDFFAVVMSGEMSRNEINCCLKQILQGVSYLHSLGLAHRDLKLDNCVLTMDGILKIIDFGSAVIFKYPYDHVGPKQEDSIHYCHGIVGSDPYLAPEVLANQNSYNPQPVDLWSIAIIYCCMTLKRFPWKIPNPEKDNSFKLYAMDDDNWHDYHLSNETHKLLLRQRHLKNILARSNKKKKLLKMKAEAENGDEEESSRSEADLGEKLKGVSEVEVLGPAQVQQITSELDSIEQQLEDYEKTKAEMKAKFAESKRPEAAEQAPPEEPNDDEESVPRKSKAQHKQIHGPYRLMRLLPHVSRPIIHKMLQIDPLQRASIEEIMDDEWIKSIDCCTYKSTSDTSGGNIDEEEETVLVKGEPVHEHTVVLDSEGK